MKLTRRYREHFLKTVLNYQGTAVGFRCDRVQVPGRTTAAREYLTHPGAVGILAFSKPDEIVLVKQYRYPVKEFTYELPAGKLAPGEDPGRCVRRELAEET